MLSNLTCDNCYCALRSNRSLQKVNMRPNISQMTREPVAATRPKFAK